MAKTKVNPRRRPIKLADIERAAKVTRDKAIKAVMAMMFMSAVDVLGCDEKALHELYTRTNKYAEEISEGRITISDLTNTLKEEYEIKFS